MPVAYHNETVNIELGKYRKKISHSGFTQIYDFNKSPKLELTFLAPNLKWLNMFCIAQPRYGKSAICKHIVAKLSPYVKVCILDKSGEWIRTITKYNFYS